MRTTILTILFAFFVSFTYAQQSNYIYIEADNGQGFYTRIGEKVQSSSQGGYLILADLRDSSYDIRIGFPKDAFPEQRFTIPLNGKDRGFQLKNFGEKGWGLFNLQTLDLIMNSSVQSNVNETKKTDPFSVLLSKVVNDPAVLTVDNNSSTIKDTPPVTVAIKDTIISQPSTNPDSSIINSKPIAIRKLFEKEYKTLYRVVYIDQTNGGNDTIHISYPITR